MVQHSAQDGEQQPVIRSLMFGVALAVSIGACAGTKAPKRPISQAARDAGPRFADAGPDTGVRPADAAGLGDASPGSVDAAADKDASAADLACGVQTSEAHLAVMRSVDVIFIIDNSGSMENEIQGVQDNINDNFARIIEESGADYHVIMLSSHGDAAAEHICIRAPLSTTSCNPIPAEPQNGPRFFHYDFDIQSWDSLCRVLETFDAPDQHAFTTMGWQEWLRPEALKVFVEISDDGVDCTTARGDFTPLNSGDAIADAAATASAFNTALLALSPTQFGTKSKPNYVWHSIIGIKANQPPDSPWLPKAPLQSGICSTAAAAGEGYQMLSISTGGLRYPVCEGQGFDAVFRTIAGDVVKSSGIECRFSVPEPPQGKYVDLASISVQYKATTGKTEALKQVAAKACDAHGFVVDGGDVKLCPDACTRVRADQGAQLSVRFGCGQKPPDAPL